MACWGLPSVRAPSPRRVVAGRAHRLNSHTRAWPPVSPSHHFGGQVEAAVCGVLQEGHKLSEEEMQLLFAGGLLLGRGGCTRTHAALPCSPGGQLLL